MRHVLVALVQDEPGMLARMGNLFARRGYNVVSFTAGASELPNVTRITIVVEGPSTALDQVAKQFRKLIGAIKVADVTEDKDQMSQEMLLVKVGVSAKTRQEVVSLADLFKARIVDVSTTTLLLEATGEPDKLDKLVEVLKPFGIKEQARTGAIFMGRGAKVLNQRPGGAADRKYLPE
ncbi:MAG TPA: acetolactate synthase small subunit [Candidatus Baltobacteraceae bacterium]|nr:acetolactate synthase small subunit [Candidatus Baltobacteraceae bacterium]